MESEALSSAKTEKTPSDSDIKQERPARKRSFFNYRNLKGSATPYILTWLVVTIRDPGIGMYHGFSRITNDPNNVATICFFPPTP
ncbi:hypothetical protein Golax_007175 [Gossypium laxum]|uniref:Uncharacterized protein n=1 Tax=Gossypium laxum TaxID=34288 RepID=A0A7J9A605_9ROSI|nr:hypothetical protein [Gossypium laxum]